MTVVHSLHLANSFWPHGLQHPRLACSSLSLGVCSNSCQLSQWCYLTISSSAISFLFCPQSFSVSRSFPVNRLVALGSQSIGASALAVLSMYIPDWSPSGWTGWTSLQFKGLSRVFSITTVQKHWFFDAHPSLWSNSHICMWLLVIS